MRAANYTDSILPREHKRCPFRMLLHCWWECKLVQPLWRTVWRLLKKLKIELPYDPAILLLGIHPEKNMVQKEIGRAHV